MFVEALLCTHCRVLLKTRAFSAVQYHRCPSCGRTFASTYDEAIRHAAGVKRVQVETRAPSASTRAAAEPPPPEAPPDPRWSAVKDRLEAFLRRVDERVETEPHRVLGVRAGASVEEIRSRYRELALRHHPDRGGDAAEMRKVNEAYRALRR